MKLFSIIMINNNVKGSDEGGCPFNIMRLRAEPDTGMAAIYFDQFFGEMTGERHKKTQQHHSRVLSGKRRSRKRNQELRRKVK